MNINTVPEKIWLVRRILARHIETVYQERCSLILNNKLNANINTYTFNDTELAEAIRESDSLNFLYWPSKIQLRDIIIGICQEFRFNHETTDRAIEAILGIKEE